MDLQVQVLQSTSMSPHSSPLETSEPFASRCLHKEGAEGGSPSAESPALPAIKGARGRHAGHALNEVIV